jgi:hypothetical protein
MVELLIKAAEGLEAKSQKQTEQKIQFFGLVITSFTVAAVFMDGYNFLVGQPPTDLVSPYRRSVIYLVSVLMLMVVMLAFSKVLIGMMRGLRSLLGWGRPAR